MNLIRNVILTALLFTGLCSRAQQKSDTSGLAFYKKLDSVEINAFKNRTYVKEISTTGTKTPTPVIDIPQTVSSVTRELISDKMQFELKDAVTNAANVNSYSGYDEYSIRGFLAENPRSVNGLRGFNSTYTSLLLFNIESVDVIKGPAAVLYGNSDPGGTVNLVTKKPLNIAAGQVDLFGGSWNHFRAAADFTGPLNASKTILYRINGGYDQSKGMPDQFHSNAYQIAPSFTFIPGKNIQVNVDLSYSNINTVLYRGQPGLETGNDLYATPVKTSLTQPGNYLKEKDLSAMVSFAWKITDKLSFHSAYLNYQVKQNVAEHGFDSYATDDSVNLYYQTWNYKAVTNSWTNYFNYHFNAGEIKQDVLLGYDYISTSGTTAQTRYENPDVYGEGSGIVGGFNLLYPVYNQLPASRYVPSEAEGADVDVDQYHTQGIYIQDQISYRKWNMLVGLRREFYRTAATDDDTAGTVQNVWLPRLGLVYDISPDYHIYGVYSRGFDPYEISNPLAEYNEPFKPVNSELFEIGLKSMIIPGKLYGTLSVYQLSIYNVAVNANDPSNPNLFIQRGEDQARGAELELNGNILPNLQAHFAYAYNVAQVKESVIHDEIGKLKENAPRNSGNGFFKYGFNKGNLRGFSVTAGYTFVGKRNTLDPEFTLPAYFTMQAGVNYQWHPVTVSVLMNNIANTEYWKGAYNNIYKWPGEGRNIMIKLSYDLGLGQKGKK